MGTWGVHSFENDDAVEWAAAYREMGLSVAASTIRIALEDHANNRLSADIAARGIAAVEAIAHALGRGSADAKRLFDGAPAEDRAAAEALLSDANELLASVTGGSELAQLRKEADPGEYDAWLNALTELRARLNAVSAPAEAPKAAPATVTEAATLEDIRRAIGALAHDVEGLRQEMSENFARLSRRMEGFER